MALSAASIIVGLVAVLFIRFGYRLFLHPLSVYPGPSIASITHVWFLRQYLSGTSHLTLQRLHEKYGPIVRISPSSLSFSTLEAWEVIYGFKFIEAFEKGDSYNFGRDPSTGAESLFSARTATSHRRHRRQVVGTALQPATASRFEGIVEKNAREFIGNLEALGSGVVDIAETVHSYTFDTATEIIHGDQIRSSDVAYWADIRSDFRNKPPMIWGAGYWPILTWLFSTKIMRAIIRKPKFDVKGRPTGIGAMVTRVIGLITKEPAKILESKQSSLVASWLDVPEGDSRFMSAVQIGKEALNLTFAGSDSMAAGLTAVLWELANNPEWQQRIRGSEGKEVLPAVIKEALRLHPPFPTAFTRVVAKPGINADVVPGLKSALPIGTTVGANSYLLNRSPAIWGPLATSFQPSRFLPGNTNSIMNDLRSVDDRFITFGGKSPRGCIGQDVAMMVMRMGVEAVLEQWDISTMADNEGTGGSRPRKGLVGKSHLEMIYKECNLVLKKRST